MAGQGGGLQFLHCRDQDGQMPRILRLMTREGAVNYLDFVVLKSSDGAARG